MARTFEILDHRTTPMGDLVLRRRTMPTADATDVWEITLDGAFLMSSLVHESESVLATATLVESRGDDLTVLVGGLGLGWTARAALDDPRVGSVTILERFDAVIDWHRRGLVPLGDDVASDDRTHFVEGDVFVHLRETDARYDAILLDVDHSPHALLDASHASFYEPEGLRRTAGRLTERGVFGLWSADAPDGPFLARLEAAFGRARAEAIRFFNPHVGAEEINTVYVAAAR